MIARRWGSVSKRLAIGLEIGGRIAVVTPRLFEGEFRSSAFERAIRDDLAVRRRHSGGMTTPHPLDRPIWNTLATRHAALAEGDDRARRFRPSVNLFAAARDDGADAQAALAALMPAGGQLGLVEAAPPQPLAGTRVVFEATLYQMVLEGALAPTTDARATLDWVDLGDADAPAMLELATLTRPGPFFAETHRLGRFIGIKRDGRLVAMAGERMKVPGFAEVSAVCTHPDWRGHGFGIGLMRIAIERMLADGDAVFLHAYPDNPAVRLYEALGFRVRREMHFTILAPA